jgi:hypothetical protein
MPHQELIIIGLLQLLGWSVLVEASLDHTRMDPPLGWTWALLGHSPCTGSDFIWALGPFRNLGDTLKKLFGETVNKKWSTRRSNITKYD